MTDSTTTGNVAGSDSTPTPASKRKTAARRPAKRRVTTTTDKVEVTYLGPKDPKDPTTIVSVPHNGARKDETFPINETVTTSNSTGERLAAMAGHKFTIEPAKPEGA